MIVTCGVRRHSPPGIPETQITTTMAFGKHWEWRGFGDVSQSFLDRFDRLQHAYGPDIVRDWYLWAPGMRTNLKIREGEMGGLKFKRFVAADGRLSCWQEDPEELFPLPLGREGWQALTAELYGLGIMLPAYPVEPPHSERLLAMLSGTGLSRVLVEKERMGRQWPGPNGRVLVDYARIKTPQRLTTIGLESENLGAVGDELTDTQAKEDLRAAIEALALAGESLAEMGYMKALALWSSYPENKI